MCGIVNEFGRASLKPAHDSLEAPVVDDESFAHADPFRHVEGLRAHMVAVEDSAHRMSRAVIEEWDRVVAEAGVLDWRYTHAHRDALRDELLGDRVGSQVWVFGFGSLMWDPGFVFDEIRVATLNGASRAFRLLDTIGRGSPSQPGLMAGLQVGGCCNGLAFRIPAELAAAETDVIWMREMIAPGYRAEFVIVHTPQGEVEALCFFLDESCETCLPPMSEESAASLIATGNGPAGTSRTYLETLVRQLKVLNLADGDMERLYELVCRRE